MPAAPLLLVTRPDPDGTATAAEIAARLPVETIVSPVVARTDTGAVWQGPAPDGVILTSSAALSTLAAQALPSGLPAWCVGDRTAEAAERAGFAARSANGDADALVALVTAERPAGLLVHLRGENSRGDVAGRLRAAGLSADDLVVYRQSARPLTDAARAALDGDAPVVAPLYSPFSARALADQGPFRAPLHLVAISEATAQAASGLPAESVAVAEVPSGNAMIRLTDATLRTLFPRGALLEGPPSTG